jgi:hypothetical protein
LDHFQWTAWFGPRLTRHRADPTKHAGRYDVAVADVRMESGSGTPWSFRPATGIASQRLHTHSQRIGYNAGGLANRTQAGNRDFQRGSGCDA